MRPDVRRARLALAVLLLAGACARPSSTGRAAPGSPEAAVGELLAADRAFSAASARTDLVTGLSRMFAADVVMPGPGGLASGAAAATESLKANPANAASRAEWTPVRGGVSADGQHGFTFGYMTQTRADGTRVPLKYLAYWVRQPDGWRVAVYKRGRRPAEGGPTTTMSPALPARMVRPSTDAAAIEAFRQSLDEAERAFSDRAQRIGLGAAFTEYGSADAVNMGGPDDTTFVLGAAAIGRLVSVGSPPNGSSVSWAPERVLVASSGDLGVTIGTIRPNAPPAAGGPAGGVPFFTIWRRANTSAPWRYVAE